MGNFDVNLSPEDEQQLKQLAKDTSYSQLAGGFQNYAQGEMALGAGQGMAQGGAGTEGAFLGAGFGLASAFGAQQAAAQQAQQQAAQQAAAQQGMPPYGPGGQQQAVPPYGQGAPPPGVPPYRQGAPQGASPSGAPPAGQAASQAVARPGCASCQASNPAGVALFMDSGPPAAPS